MESVSNKPATLSHLLPQQSQAYSLSLHIILYYIGDFPRMIWSMKLSMKSAQSSVDPNLYTSLLFVILNLGIFLIHWTAANRTRERCIY